MPVQLLVCCGITAWWQEETSHRATTRHLISPPAPSQGFGPDARTTSGAQPVLVLRLSCSKALKLQLFFSLPAGSECAQAMDTSSEHPHSTQPSATGFVRGAQAPWQRGQLAPALQDVSAPRGTGPGSAPQGESSHPTRLTHRHGKPPPPRGDSQRSK